MSDGLRASSGGHSSAAALCESDFGWSDLSPHKRSVLFHSDDVYPRESVQGRVEKNTHTHTHTDHQPASHTQLGPIKHARRSSSSPTQIHTRDALNWQGPAHFKRPDILCEILYSNRGTGQAGQSMRLEFAAATGLNRTISSGSCGVSTALPAHKDQQKRRKIRNKIK